MEDSEKFLDRLTERNKPEKRKSKQIGFRVPSKKKAISLDDDSSKKVSDGKLPQESNEEPIEDQENHVNSIINDSNEPRDTNGTPNKSTNSNPDHSVPSA